MKTILIATDFSEHAKIAGETALTLARRFDANLVCVHASLMRNTDPESYDLANDQLEEFRRALQQGLGEQRQWLKLLADEAGRQGVKAYHHLVDGSPAEAICAAAEEAKADLVVLGSHGLTGLKRFLLGSVAEKVVRMSHCSVLVARPPVMNAQGYRRILVPTDFEEGADKALEWARALAAPDASIDVLHCWQVAGIVDGSLEPAATTAVYAAMASTLVDEANARGKALVEQLRGQGRTVNFHLTEGRSTAAVQKFMESQDILYDLVCVGTHGRQGLKRLFLGSVAETTVRYSPCSVLVARNR